MQSLLLAAISYALASAAAMADGMSLAGSLWQCTRATDQSQFVMTFYPGGGVGGGEFENSEVSPYIWICRKILFQSFSYGDPSHRSGDTDVQRQAF